MDNERKVIEDAKDAVLRIQHETKEDWVDEKYTKSIVTYIDICGTKDLFLSSEDDFQNHKKSYEKIDELIRRVKASEWIIAMEKLYGGCPVKITVVSDGIVLSLDVNFPEAFDKIFMVTGLFITSLFGLNPPRFTRSAITIGNIFHENNIVFGPALVKAAVLEADRAKNFRCIIHVDHYEEIKSFYGDLTKNILEGYFFRADNDLYSFDYLFRFLHEAENAAEINDDFKVQTYLTIFNNIYKQSKLEAINKMHSKHVRKKYIWMKNYLISTMKKALMSSDDEFIWLKNEYNKHKAKPDGNSKNRE